MTCASNCVLQVAEFMSDHGLNNPGGCFYHHCANITIQAGGTDAGAHGVAEDSGCGCAVAETRTSLPGMLAMVLLAAVRRRRRR
jgi:MYXO-CTERM domain-containing protein